MEYQAHQTAVIDKGATIGAKTKIWHWTHISSGAKIGTRCSIGQNVFIGSKAVLGNQVKVQNNVSVYDAVTLEDDVFCGPSMVFTNVINPRSHIIRKSEYRKTLIKKGVTIGANATILCGITIGQYAFIGAGAVVNKNIPDYALIVGNPGRQIGWMCECGVRIEMKSKSDGICPACGKKYLVEGDVCKPCP